MSKRAIFIFGGVILFSVCFYIGFNLNREEKAENNVAIINSVKVQDKVDNTIKNEVIEVSAKEEKTTPGTMLVFKKYYKDCEHTISNISNIEENQVNLTEEELKKRYPNWEIEKFSSKEVILTKNLESFCRRTLLIK